MNEKFDDLESPLEKRGLKTDTNKHENKLQVNSDESTPDQSSGLFSEDYLGSLLNRESELPVPSTFLKVRSMKGGGS